MAGSQRAVLFDLDGTLNGLDIHRFVPRYFETLGAYVADLIEPARLARELWQATQALIGDQRPDLTNFEKFDRAFLPHDPSLKRALYERFDRFYAEAFDRLAVHAPRNPLARPVVETVRRMGMRVVIATNPVFPEAAILRRLAWAGLDDVPFDLVTVMENMHHCKPHPEYYREIASRLGIDPSGCLMVGNDRDEDMAAARAGMRTFWVTDLPIDRGRLQLQPDGQGSLSSLVPWIEARLANW